MFKKIVFAVFMILILAASGYSVWLMYASDDLYSVQMNGPVENAPLYDPANVFSPAKSDLAVMLNCEGFVSANGAEAAQTFFVRGTKDNIKLNIALGETAEAGTIAAKGPEDEIKLSGTMRCIRITWREEGCELVFYDFDAVCAEIMIPQRFLEYDLYSYDYDITAGNQRFKGKLEYLDYMVSEDGFIRAKLHYDTDANRLLQGIKLSVSAKMAEKKDVLTLSLSMIAADGDLRYVTVLDDHGGLRTQEVRLGEISMDDCIAEICSGVSEEMKIVPPSETMSLYTQLMNAGGTA